MQAYQHSCFRRSAQYDLRGTIVCHSANCPLPAACRHLPACSPSGSGGASVITLSPTVYFTQCAPGYYVFAWSGDDLNSDCTACSCTNDYSRTAQTSSLATPPSSGSEWHTISLVSALALLLVRNLSQLVDPILNQSTADTCAGFNGYLTSSALRIVASWLLMAFVTVVYIIA